MHAKTDNLIERPPVIVIMGHIDHGKSTLLDYIRRSNTTSQEAGGITQHLSAYEVEHHKKDGSIQKITFLDTPGHEAFSRIRTRGASVADIAVLIVSAEDGVMPQTKEALNTILASHTPYIVAINKIDSPRANVERVKQNLAEHEIYIEEYGGTIPCVAISAKTGQGIDDLLDMMLLVAEVEEMTASPSVCAQGVVIEAHRDPHRGISATLIIKDGSLHQGQFVASAGAYSPIRLMENYRKEKIAEARFSSPVSIIGWSAIPDVGLDFKTFDSKKDAELYAHASLQENSSRSYSNTTTDALTIPVIIKTEVSGTVDAIEHEIRKINTDNVEFVVVHSAPGTISEADIKRAAGKEGTVVVGFGTTIDHQAQVLRDRLGIDVKTFSIIYELADWLESIRNLRTPKKLVEDVQGHARILKLFNMSKGLNILGGKVESGQLALNSQVYITRKGERLGKGIIKGMQKNKSSTEMIREDDEFGMALETKVELDTGDVLEAFTVTEK